MKRYRILYIVPVFALLISLTGCCMHSWTEATCTEPKTCSKCGAIEGAAKGHTFHEATCNAPKTCDVCGYTEGEKLEHHFLEATCDNPETCEYCGLTKGEALGHTTKLGICSRCNETQFTLALCALDMKEGIYDGMKQLTKGLEKGSTALSMYTDVNRVSYTVEAYYEFMLASVDFDRALMMCGDDPEFAEVKKHITVICDTMEGLENIKSVSSSNYLTVLNRIIDSNETISKHINEFEKIANTWQPYIDAYNENKEMI